MCRSLSPAAPRCDWYLRCPQLLPAAHRPHGTVKLDNSTNLGSILISATTELFERIADKTLTVRRITIAANRVVKDEGFFQVDLFTDTTKLEKEKKLQNAMLGLKKKFGKNAVLKGTNYLNGATMRERNQQIGGHKAK